MVHSSSTSTRNSLLFSCLVSALLLSLTNYIDPTLGISTFTLISIVIYFLYTFGMRDKWSGDANPSAYSVFNKGHREVAGGFTAAQFDSQLRHKAPADEKTQATFKGVQVSRELSGRVAKTTRNKQRAMSKRGAPNEQSERAVSEGERFGPCCS